MARRSGSELAADRAWRRTGTEARILTAAADAFASGGYEATSMQAIAARAGVSVGLLYRHSASKEALFAAALERTTEAAVSRLAADRDPAADAAAHLRAGEAWLADQLARGAWPGLMRQAWAASATHPEIRRAAQRQALVLDGLAVAWVRGAIAGDPEVADRPELPALVVRMLLNGAIAHAAERHAPGQAAAVASAAGSLLRRAIIAASNAVGG